MSRDIRRKQSWLREQNKKYSSAFIPIGEEEWPPMSPRPIVVWRSRDFLAQVFRPADGGQRISVCRTMIDDIGRWVDGITWEQLMYVKNGIGFGDSWAVEIYPSNDGVVNVANMRHLWVLSEPPAFAWKRVQP